MKLGKVPTPGSTEPTNGHGLELAKLVRLGTMLARLLDELHREQTSDETCAHLRPVHEAAVQELITTLPEDLRAEFGQVVQELSGSPSCPELRIAEAQVLGWLQGVLQAVPVPSAPEASVSSATGQHEAAETSWQQSAYL